MLRASKSLAFFLLISTFAPVATLSQTSNCPSLHADESQQKPIVKNSIKLKRTIFSGKPALSAEEQADISVVLSDTKFASVEDVREMLPSLVRSQWQKRGYFKVFVGAPEIKVDSPDGDFLSVTIPVQAGDQYRLEGLRLVKNTAFPEEELRPLIAMQRGEIFDTWKVANGIVKIRELYASKGYINMVIIPTTQETKSGNAVNLTFEIDEGSQFHVGAVDVLAQDEATRRRFLADSGLITGAVYDASKSRKFLEPGSSEAVVEVSRSIDESNRAVNFKVDLGPCSNVSQK